ncbi:MAG TPA: amidoligase family protein [Hyphomicrobiaceae bacterium]|nr:amidoligase family protein [Hyphomicrobiaceae bacterium]
MTGPRHIPKPTPRPFNFEGKPRRVGVELEFAALSARDVASRIHVAFGGRTEEIDPHCFRIFGTELGTFKAELDTSYARRSQIAPNPENDPLVASFQAITDTLREFYGDISSLIVPCEIVAPPLTIENLGRLDKFITNLTEAGALGTNSSPFYAFGTHFNPDIATRDPQWILAILKAELLLSDWLRGIMAIDLSRRIAAFAAPFPRPYMQKILSPGYWPDTGQLIEDYLRANPTRDRELDMLPLFAWLDEKRVRAALPNIKIQQRPTFHFRLPNANLGIPDWSLGLEWNRWCVVERLAEDRERLNAMAQAYLENDRRWIPESWALRASDWLIV